MASLLPPAGEIGGPPIDCHRPPQQGPQRVLPTDAHNLTSTNTLRSCQQYTPYARAQLRVFLSDRPPTFQLIASHRSAPTQRGTMSKQVAAPVQTAPQTVSQWAQEHTCCIVPALPNSEDRAVHLDSDDMTLEDFCRTAANLGIRVLYQEVDTFDADEFAVLPALPLTAGPDSDLPDPEAALDSAERKDLAALRAAARRHHGQTAGIELCFVADSVAHFWSDSAPWWDDLAEQWDDFTSLLQHTREEQEQQAEAAEQIDAQAEIARMTDTLAALPAFRSATNHATRRAVASDAFPDSDDEPHHSGYLLRQAVAAASDRVQADALAAYRDVEKRIDEIAEKLAASDALADATTQPTRRIKAADFLTTLTGGYPPNTRTVTLLLGHRSLTVPAARTGRPAPDTLPLG
ncbi:hypothetical protein [Streptomyces sp. NPDC005096]|uniref:hypothetical protein n=1 Tax=Streptomyces sp. NPDC005096 TaxID=3154559 RepID=UPI0033AA24B1